MNLAEIAAGRELEILEQVAGIPREYLNKKGHPCPRCGGKDRFSLIDEARGTVFCRHCFSHGNRGYVNAVIHYGQAADYKEARQMILDHLNTGNQLPSTPPALAPKLKPVSLIPKEWVYLDENGNFAKKIKRYGAKTETGSKHFVPFVYYQAQWRSKNDFKKESEWKASWQRVAGLPLNLPEIRQRTDAAVYIVEGEKCCDQLQDWQFLATTGSGGSNTTTDWTKYLAGRNVIILPDNDKPGYKYALKTAKSLQDKAAQIRIVFLPDIQESEDIVDWANAGGTREQL
jgi:5S rRNA maturation endonuclease (ribonuclease M5)